MAVDLPDRQRRILARLVAEYIEHGEPVASAWLAEHSDLGLSSASVRTILARLEEQGLVRQPHTSAGRVPTDAGYRLYVDGLLESRKPPRAAPDVGTRLRHAGTVSDLLEHASQELSRASRQVGFALAPASPLVRLKHLDFVGLEGCRILAIVVATGGQITHRVIETEGDIDSTLLAQAANYVNREFVGMTIAEARAAIVERLRQERLLADALIARALRLASTGLSDVAPDGTLHIQGASNLVDEILGGPADRDWTAAALGTLLRLIEQKHQLVALLTRYLDGTGLTVVIGSEHASPDFRPFSLVASTFQDGDRTGGVGVIGPTRMRYARAISVVESVSRTMTSLLDPS